MFKSIIEISLKIHNMLHAFFIEARHFDLNKSHTNMERKQKNTKSVSQFIWSAFLFALIKMDS